VNYLAHAYLSFGEPEILTGNLISDFVKGRKKYDYPPHVLAGIDLHRAIDIFTDEHPVNKEVSKLFKPNYGLYSSAFIDVVYDHFLAKQLSTDPQFRFEPFTHSVYDALDRFNHLFPHTFRNFFPYMKQHNWLFNYQYAWGIENSIAGLVHRAKYMSDARTAYEIFTDRYDELSSAFNIFFPELHKFALEKFSDIH